MFRNIYPGVKQLSLFLIGRTSDIPIPRENVETF